MRKLRKVSKEYYLRQIIACWMIFSMAVVMPAQIAMAVSTPGADALPSGIINSTGINAPVITGLNMDITQTAGEAIINWNNFDIGADAGVKFIQPGSAAAVLNRVHDGNVTGIMGSLAANGRVFVINPAGMVFGEGAVVNVSQLVASSLNITDDDFMNGVYKFAGGGIGEVANYGRISAEQVALIGRKVLNAGVIEAPAGTVIMAAGDKVFLGVEGSDVVVEVTGVTLPGAADAEFQDGDVINEGTIEASGGKIVLAAGDTWSRAVDGVDGLTVAADGGAGRVGQFGTINADGIDGDGGSITLTAGDVVVLGEESVTTANAGTNGDGGEVIAYSPGTATFEEGAQIEARGGELSGNGGFVEMSGLEGVLTAGFADLRAPAGQAGIFLLDPYNIWISDSPVSYDNVNATWLEDQLGLGDFLVDTSGMGDITVTDPVSWASIYGLMFDAGRDIFVDAPVTNSGTGYLTMEADRHIMVNAPLSTGGDLNLYADASGNIVGNMYSDAGATLYAGGDIDIKGNDIILGDAVEAGGNLTITGRDCDPEENEYEWGNVYAMSTLDAGGDIEISVTGETEERYKDYDVYVPWRSTWVYDTEYHPGTITLDGDVTAGANLSLFNDTYTTNVTGHGVTLQAGQDVFLKNDNAGFTEKDNLTKLEGQNYLAIIAGAGPGVTNGEIHADDTTISVTGSTLVMHQDKFLDTANYMFGNQGATDLTLISDKGSVTSTRTADGGLTANAADKWNTIGATAKHNINLSGNGSIILGDSGTNPNLSLHARNGNVNVRAGYNVAAQKHILAGNDIRIHTRHGVRLQGARAGNDMTVKADVDTYWGENVTANNRLEAGRDMTLEGSNVILKNGGEAGGDMDITAHGLYSRGGGAPGTLVGGGDVVVDGALTAGGSMNITAINYQDAAPPTNGPGFWGGSTPYNADGSIYLNDGATAGDMTLLADTYIEAGKKLITTSGALVAHAGTNGGTDFQLTNRPPAPGTSTSQYDVVLKDGAESSTNMVVTAADDIKSDGKLTSGNNMGLKAGDDILLNKAGVSAESGANMKIFADRDNANTPPIGDVDVAGDLLAENNIEIKASNNTIYLGGDVKTNDGNITFYNKVVADGVGNQTFNARDDGPSPHNSYNLRAKSSITKTSDGDLTLMGGREANGGLGDAKKEILLGGDVDVQKGSLLIGVDGKDGDVLVAGGKTLSARDHVIVEDTLEGIGSLSISATRGDIRLKRDVNVGGNLRAGAGRDIVINEGSTTIGNPDHGNLHADNNMGLVAGNDITVYGVATTGTGNMTMTADNNINLLATPLSADSGANMTLTADADDDNVGNVDVEGDLEAQNNISIAASNNTIYLAGDVKTHDGNITFHNKVVADGAGKQVFNANAAGGKVLWARKSITKTTQGNLKLMGGRIGNDGADDTNIELDLDGNVIVKDGSLFLGLDGKDDDVSVAAGKKLKASQNVTVFDTLNGEGALTVKAGNDITLHKDVTSAGDMLLKADNDGSGAGDMIAMGNLESTGGSIDIHSANTTTYLGGDYVKALDDVTLHNKTILNGNGNQKIQATTGKLTAKHHVRKINDGNLRLKGNDGIYLAGNVTTENGNLIFADDVTANGTGGRKDQKFNANAGGGKVLYAKGTITKTTEGDLTLMGGRINAADDTHIEIDLDGDVKVQDGSLFIGLDGQDDDTTVAAGGLLKASEDVTVFDTLNGEGNLTVEAGRDITLHKEVTVEGDLEMTADDDIFAHGKLTTNGTTADGDMTLNADDDIYLYATPTSADAAGELKLIADSDNNQNGNLTIYGDIYGNMTLSGYDVTEYGNITSYGTLDVDADDDISLKANISSVGAMTMNAGDNIELNRSSGNTSSESTITLNAGDDITIGKAYTDEGNVTADGDMNITAGTGWFDDITVYGKLTTTNGGNINVRAGNDITIYGTNSGDIPSVYESVEADGTLTIIAGDDLYAAGSLEGNMTLSGDNVTVDGTVTSHGILDVDADEDIKLKTNVSSEDAMTMNAGKDIRLNQDSGETISDSTITLIAGRDVKVEGNLTTTGNNAVGDVLVEAGRDIRFGGNVNADGHLQASSGLADESWWLWFYNPGAGSIEAYGDVIAASMQLEAGAGLPDYSDSHVSVGGLLQTTSGDMIVSAHHDVLLRGDVVESAGSLVLNADRHGDYGYPDPHTFGGDVEVAGTVDAVGTIDMYGNNITLDKDVTSGGDMTLRGDTSSDFKDALPEGDVTAMGNLTSTGGSVSIYSSDDTTYLGGDVTAYNNVLLNNNTEFFSDDDQHVTAKTGSVTANGYLEKPEDGSLYLLANSLEVPETDSYISLADHVTVENGGISIIAKTGKIFTPDKFGGETDTLNVDISGTSDHMAGIGVDLPKDYDQPAPEAAGEYETGKAAIVIMSEKALKLGSSGTLTAKGKYYDDGSVDDRPGVDFANYDRPDKPGGDPIDIAIYLAGNSREVLDDTGVPISSDYEGDVHVGSPVADLPDGAVMVADAYDTVTFGDAFEDSLKDGNVDWLEVCSRISGTYGDASNNDKLPKSAGKGWDLDNYVWRGEGGGDDGGAWILEPPALPADPRAQFQVPMIEGCPQLVQAAAAELGITAETIQVGIGNAIALSPSIQACQACAKLVDAAAILRDEDGSRMAAMVRMFNELAPADAPFTPATAASIAMAFEGAAEGSQYASVMEYIDAFTQYVAVLDIELGSPVGDSVAFVMEKHGAAVMGSDNANIAAFVATHLEAIGQL